MRISVLPDVAAALGWTGKQPVDEVHEDLEHRVFVSQALVDGTNSRYQMAFIGGQHDQHLIVMSAQLSPSLATNEKP